MAAVRARFGETIRAGRRLHPERPVRGRHPPAGHLPHPAGLPRPTRCWATSCTVAHHTDIGGRVAGGNACDSTEIYQEGLRIPPLRLYDRGELNDGLLRLIEKNVRIPDKVLGDLRAQLAACHIGERGLLELVERYGRAT